MGFIPIFIYLGGFVFLFMMVVHQHLKQKRRNFERKLTDISSVLKSTSNTSKTDNQLEHLGNVKDLEKSFQSLIETEKSGRFLDESISNRQKFSEAKRLRYEYNKLIATKPYSFVARLLGHHPL